MTNLLFRKGGPCYKLRFIYNTKEAGNGASIPRNFTAFSRCAWRGDGLRLDFPKTQTPLDEYQEK